MQLPLEYEKKMRLLLADLGEEEFEKYERALESERFFGLRVNTLKISPEAFQSISPFPLEPVPWAENGFYYKDGFPGRHPFYHAGLYYIQEPSAMYPGACLRPEPGDMVLDICAAPGGKTTQLASYMRGRGLLVSNDISAERVKALVKNVEMAGIRNCIITNETPENLRRNFTGFFDKILVDAPCSGEGMFRKDEAAIGSWENYKSARCREMQDAILDEVHYMLKPGGKLLYSTCTFSPSENEQTIEAFLDRHPNYILLELPKCAGIADGVPKWGSGAPDLEKTARLWPQRIKGEGHFTALLQKTEDAISPVTVSTNKSFTPLSELPACVLDFYRKNMKHSPPEGFYCAMGNNLYYLPELPPSVDGLKIARLGLFLGMIKGKAFKPSHPFVSAQEKDAFQRYLHLSPGESDLRKYLRGETLLRDSAEDGLTAVCVDSFPLGWGSSAGGVIKNMYPKGWRRMD